MECIIALENISCPSPIREGLGERETPEKEEKMTGNGDTMFGKEKISLSKFIFLLKIHKRKKKLYSE